MDDALWRKLSRQLMSLDLSVRTLNCLESIGLETVGDLVQQREEWLRRIPAFGETCAWEVTRKLAAEGLHLGMQLDFD